MANFHRYISCVRRWYSCRHVSQGIRDSVWSRIDVLERLTRDHPVETWLIPSQFAVIFLIVGAASQLASLPIATATPIAASSGIVGNSLSDRNQTCMESQMEPSSRTPEGDDNTCRVCGHDVRIEPSRPPGDATCPHCGALLWFADEITDTSNDVQAARQWKRALAAVESNDLRLAEKLLRMACVLDPSNVDFKKKREEVRLLNQDAKRKLRRKRERPKTA